MKKIKQLWDFLNGKKSNIGLALLLFAQGIQVFFPDLMTHEQINFLQTTGSLMGGIGLMHKAGKSPYATKPKKK